MKGLNKDYIDFITSQVIKLKERWSIGILDRILWHHKQNHLVFFISGALIFIIKDGGKI